MCSVLVQRGVTDDEEDVKSASFYIVWANVGDSSCLMLPHPDDKEEDFSEGDDIKYQRLAREHSPDDPLEAQRLVSAGYRLARMSNNRSGKRRGVADVPRRNRGFASNRQFHAQRRDY